MRMHIVASYLVTVHADEEQVSDGAHNHIFSLCCDLPKLFRLTACAASSVQALGSLRVQRIEGGITAHSIKLKLMCSIAMICRSRLRLRLMLTRRQARRLPHKSHESTGKKSKCQQLEQG